MSKLRLGFKKSFLNMKLRNPPGSKNMSKLSRKRKNKTSKRQTFELDE